jgi:hypothetical protein
MPNTNQIVRELKKKLSPEELKKIPRAKFSVKKLNYTEEWYYMRKMLEPILNAHLVDGAERDEKTSKVISKLRRLLKKEKNTDKNSEIRDKQQYKKRSADPPEVEQIGSNVFKVKTEEKTEELKAEEKTVETPEKEIAPATEIATESKPIFTDRQMGIIEKGAAEFMKNEQKIQDAIDGKPPEEIGPHPYYDFNKIK